MLSREKTFIQLLPCWVIYEFWVSRITIPNQQFENQQNN